MTDDSDLLHTWGNWCGEGKEGRSRRAALEHESAAVIGGSVGGGADFGFEVGAWSDTLDIQEDEDVLQRLVELGNIVHIEAS